MAEESKVVGTEQVAVESTDRGLFDFMGKKKENKPQEEEVVVAEFEKVHVSEPEVVTKVEKEEKKEGIFDKLHRTSSSSSSSSDEEEVGEDGEKKKKKKKGLKEKLKEKISGEDERKHQENDTSVPIEVCHEEVVVSHDTPAPEEKKGFLDKIKEKLPGQEKKQEEEAPVVAESVVVEGEPKAEKKGILEKIKEKLPGYHPKTTEEEKEKEKESH